LAELSECGVLKVERDPANLGGCVTGGSAKGFADFSVKEKPDDFEGAESRGEADKERSSGAQEVSELLGSFM
jgi:hypothetical protein